MLKTVLFDLDGTLLPMNQDEFVKAYFDALATKLAPLGYNAKQLVAAIWSGTEAMVKNDGKFLNEHVFWQKFASILGEKALSDKDKFEEFYKTDFDRAQSVCGFNSKSKYVIDLLKDKKIRVALATNPIFPSVATKKRIKWAGLDPDDFELYTTYENTCFCKPNLKYYQDILDRLNVEPSETLMVGNDVGEDMVANKIGINVFLLTDCLINKNNVDINLYSHGSFEELIKYLNDNIRP